MKTATNFLDISNKSVADNFGDNYGERSYIAKEISDELLVILNQRDQVWRDFLDYAISKSEQIDFDDAGDSYVNIRQLKGKFENMFFN